MARAFQTGVYSMREIANHFGVHYSTVSRAVRRLEAGNGQTDRLAARQGNA
jgi:transposase